MAFWLDPLWHHDLIEHLTYLQHFTLVASRFSWTASVRQYSRESGPDVEFRAVPIPELSSFKAAMFRLPGLRRILWSEIGLAQIVHSGNSRLANLSGLDCQSDRTRPRQEAGHRRRIRVLVDPARTATDLEGASALLVDGVPWLAGRLTGHTCVCFHSPPIATRCTRTAALLLTSRQPRGSTTRSFCRTIKRSPVGTRRIVIATSEATYCLRGGGWRKRVSICCWKPCGNFIAIECRCAWTSSVTVRCGGHAWPPCVS